jgi:hypothetical protein
MVSGVMGVLSASFQRKLESLFCPARRDILGGRGDQIDAGDRRAAILAGDLARQDLRAEPVEIGRIEERPIFFRPAVKQACQLA